MWKSIKNHVLPLTLKMPFLFPCSVGSVFHRPHVVLSFYLVWLLLKNLFLDLQMDGSFLCLALSSDCPLSSRLSLWEWNGNASFPQLHDFDMRNVQPLDAQLSSPLPPHTGTLYLGRLHFPAFSTLHHTLPVALQCWFIVFLGTQVSCWL